jgi:hypothetical protein
MYVVEGSTKVLLRVGPQAVSVVSIVEVVSVVPVAVEGSTKLSQVMAITGIALWLWDSMHPSCNKL